MHQVGGPGCPFVGGRARLSRHPLLLQAEAACPEAEELRGKALLATGLEPRAMAPRLRGDCCKMKSEGKEIPEAPPHQRRKSRASGRG